MALLPKKETNVSSGNERSNKSKTIVKEKTVEKKTIIKDVIEKDNKIELIGIEKLNESISQLMKSLNIMKH